MTHRGMAARNLRIGYVPYSRDLKQPGDRRRFCYYAANRNLPFEIADSSKTYDLVVATERADLSIWSRYRKGRAKMIYDFIDSYLAIPPSDPKLLMRGVAKFLTRESRRLRLNHRKAILDMCRRADAVVCTTEEQKQDILQYCHNVHIILDVHKNVVRSEKNDYSADEVFNFVWEGLPWNIQSFSVISDVLLELKKTHKLALHLITDLQYYQYLGRIWKRQTEEVAREFFDPVYVYQWSESFCSVIATACDLAVIPLRLDDPFVSGKPENKLLLLWRMGLPTVVSATPVYSRVMARAGLPDMACRSARDWENALDFYLRDENARGEAARKGKEFVQLNYDEEKTLAAWDEVLRSVVGFDTANG